jgi:hypothetical protein
VLVAAAVLVLVVMRLQVVQVVAEQVMLIQLVRRELADKVLLVVMDKQARDKAQAVVAVQVALEAMDQEKLAVLVVLL